MLESWGAVDVMQLLCFVDDGLDVGAFQDGYLADDGLPLLLHVGQVVVGDVADCLETAGEDYVVRVFGVLDFGEPGQLLMVLEVFVV